MTDTLRERVARVLRAFYSDEPIAVCDGVAYKAADAAIALVRAEVIEEAAMTAEAFPARTHGNLATAPYAAAEQAADEIAAAIRALKDKP